MFQRFRSCEFVSTGFIQDCRSFKVQSQSTENSYSAEAVATAAATGREDCFV